MRFVVRIEGSTKVESGAAVDSAISSRLTGIPKVMRCNRLVLDRFQLTGGRSGGDDRLSSRSRCALDKEARDGGCGVSSVKAADACGYMLSNMLVICGFRSLDISSGTAEVEAT